MSTAHTKTGCGPARLVHAVGQGTCTAALSGPHLYVPISGLRSMSPVMVMGTAPKRPAAPCRYMRPRSSSRSMSAPEMSSGASQKWTSAPVERP